MALLPRGQREQKMVLLALLPVVAAAAFWYFVYSPRSVELQAKQERLDAVVALNQKAKAEMAKGNIGDLRRQLAEYRQNLDLIRTLVPNGNEVPALLEQISTAARRVGLDLATVDPQPVVEGEQYDTYRYGVGILGDYHDLAAFLTNVGSLTRIVIPVNLVLQAPNSTPAVISRKKQGEAVIEARFQLQTFVTRKPDPEMPKRETTGGTE
ncbi:MAG: type 4a pilus biogenesis protein PilO [Gemmatimonadaceae bacterium]